MAHSVLQARRNHALSGAADGVIPTVTLLRTTLVPIGVRPRAPMRREWTYKGVGGLTKCAQFTLRGDL